MPLFWLSFCDDTRPKGQQFVGVAIVETDLPNDPDEDALREGVKAAIRHAWASGCNPGGQVQSTLLTDAMLARMSNDQRVRMAKAPRDTLLSKEDLQHFDLI